MEISDDRCLKVDGKFSVLYNLNMEKLLLMKEACQRLGVTTKTIQRWDKEGKIRVVRTPGGRRRIPLSEVERLTGEKTLPERKMAVYARVSSNEQKKKAIYNDKRIS